MRRWVGLALVVVLALLVWVGWPEAPTPAEAPAPGRGTRKVTRFTPAPSPVPAPRPGSDAAVLMEAARGEFGADYQARVCDLCAKGTLTGEPCEAACDTDAAVTAELQVDVVDEDGRPEDRARVRVTGCQVVRATEQRTFVIDGEGTCVVQAWRRDGALFARSPEVEVHVRPGDQAYAQVEISSARTGGLGVSIVEDPEGIRLVGVMPGTPAEALGLSPGDVILEVDGVDVRELGVDGFIATMTGPEGTEIDFVVRLADDPEGPPEPLTIVRQFIDRS